MGSRGWDRRDTLTAGLSGNQSKLPPWPQFLTRATMTSVSGHLPTVMQWCIVRGGGCDLGAIGAQKSDHPQPESAPFVSHLGDPLCRAVGHVRRVAGPERDRRAMGIDLRETAPSRFVSTLHLSPTRTVWLAIVVRNAQCHESSPDVRREQVSTLRCCPRGHDLDCKEPSVILAPVCCVP